MLQKVPLHDQRENWSDFPLFSAGDKAPDYRCSTSGRGRGVHGLRSSCVVGPRGDRRGWNVTPQATRDNSSASDTESLDRATCGKTCLANKRGGATLAQNR